MLPLPELDGSFGAGACAKTAPDASFCQNPHLVLPRDYCIDLASAAGADSAPCARIFEDKRLVRARCNGMRIVEFAKPSQEKAAAGTAVADLVCHIRVIVAAVNKPGLFRFV